MVTDGCDDRGVYSAECPTRDILDRIANKWVTLVMLALMERAKRFGVLKRQVEGISQKMLTQTLRALERDGLVSRTVVPASPVQVEYALTELGKSLCTPLCAIREWSEIHMTLVASARLEFDKRRI